MFPANHALKVVAFDCDGVMFDSREANRAYYDHLLERFGLPPMTASQLVYVHMHTVGESLAHLFADPAVRKAADEYRQELGYQPFLRYMVMEPGLISLLEALRPRYKTAVATNRTDTMARVLSENHIEHLFDLVVCALDVHFPKPHPASLNRVLDHFSVSPEAVVYVGDSEVDEMAAAGANVPFIAYRNPSLTARAHIHNLSELESLLQL
jgi:HAD superfamily hydrolase (TIGR01509 family)